MSEPNDTKQSSGHFFDDLESDYANNVAFEQTVWDLKLIFGEYSDRDKTVEWHTSITIPWAQAKLMRHFLQVNIEAFEVEQGPIRVPLAMIPAEPPAPAADATPLQRKIYEIIKRRREELMKETS